MRSRRSTIRNAISCAIGGAIIFGQSVACEDLLSGTSITDETSVIDQCTEAIQRDPKSSDNAVLFLRRAEAHAKLFNTDKAINDFTAALSIDPQLPKAYSGRAWAYATKGDNQKAIADFSKAISFDQKNDWLYYSRGVAYRSQKNPQKALVDFTKALQLAPQDARTLVHRGFVYNDLCLEQDGIRDFNKAISVDPKGRWGSRAYMALGNNYAKKLQFDKAIAEYNKSIQIPGETDGYLCRSDAYRELGQHQKALADFCRAVALPADSKAAKVSYYRHAVQAHPKAPWVYAGLGDAYLQLGDSRHAIDDCTIAITLDPKFATAYAIRGFAYKKLGEREKAVQDFGKAVSLDPNLASSIALDNSDQK